MFGETDYRNNRYVHMTHDSRMELFKSESWDKMDQVTKLSLLQAEAIYYAQQNGIEKVPVFTLETRQNLCGGYASSYGRSVISVNMLSCLNPYQALNTMAHEMNHAYQDQCIRQHNNLSEGELALMKAQWGSAYATSGLAYSRQTLENDSNNAGALYVLQQREHFADDPAYIAYCASVMEEMQSMAEDYAQHRILSDTSEKSQVETAMRVGEISVYEKQTADSYIDGINEVKVNMINTAQQVEEEFESARNQYFQNRANESYTSVKGIDANNAVRGCIEEAKRNYESECKAIKQLDKHNSYETRENADYELSKLIITSQVSAGKLKDMSGALETECEKRYAGLIDYARASGLKPEEIDSDPGLDRMISDYGVILAQKNECDKYINLIDQNAKESCELGYPNYSNCDRRPEIEVLKEEQVTESVDNTIKQFYLENPGALAEAMNEAASQHKVYEYLEDIHTSKTGFFDRKKQKECLKEMGELQKTNSFKINDLQEAEKALKFAYSEKMQQYGEYVFAHSMKIYEAKSDPYLSKLSAEMVDLDQKISSTRYHMVELQTDNELMARETGLVELPGKRLEAGQASKMKEAVKPSEELELPNAQVKNAVQSLERRKEVEVLTFPNVANRAQTSAKALDTIKLPEAVNRNQSLPQDRHNQIELPKARSESRSIDKWPSETIVLPDKVVSQSSNSVNNRPHERLELPNPNINTYQKREVSANNNVAHNTTEKSRNENSVHAAPEKSISRT